MADFTDWFTNIPYFTKRWLSLTVILTLAGRFGILDPIHYILRYEPLVKKFEVSFYRKYFFFALVKFDLKLQLLYCFVFRYGDHLQLYSYTHYHPAMDFIS